MKHDLLIIGNNCYAFGFLQAGHLASLSALDNTFKSSLLYFFKADEKLPVGSLRILAPFCFYHIIFFCFNQELVCIFGREFIGTFNIPFRVYYFNKPLDIIP